MKAAAPSVGGRTLVYFCYGSQSVYDQTVFSILTVLRFAGDSRDFAVAVYCDRPSAFAALPVEVVHTDAALLDAWLDGGDYIHRRKTCVVLDALRRFGGKVVFLDSDTYATASPARLFDRVEPGRVCFHICEGYVWSTGTPFDDALAAQLTSHPLHLRSGEPVRVGPRTRMWNTGVVGVDAGDLETVRDALALSDAIWAGAEPDGPFGRKIHHAEQFAMGYAFRRHRIGEAADAVHHYWPKAAKDAFAARLPELAESGLRDRSPGNLDRLYRRRYRERGVAAAADRVKMAVRRLALAASLSVPGVRRSV